MPATLNDPPRRWISCQIETAPKGTWGSLATIGLPVVVRLAASTQLLLPWPSSPPPLPPAPSPRRRGGAEEVFLPLSASGRGRGGGVEEPSSGRMDSSSASVRRNAR